MIIWRVFGTTENEKENFLLKKWANLPSYVRILMTAAYKAESKPILLKSKCKFYYIDSAKTETSEVVAVYESTHDDMYWDNLSQPFYVYCKPPAANKTDIVSTTANNERFPMSVSFLIPDFHSKPWQKDLNKFNREYLLPIRGDARPNNNTQDNSYSNTTNLSYDNTVTGLRKTKRLITSTTISVENSDKKYSPENKKLLAICVKPMRYSAYEKYHEFIQFLAYYDMMGVDHFILYDTGSGTPLLYKLMNDAVDLGEWWLVEQVCCINCSNLIYRYVAGDQVLEFQGATWMGEPPNYQHRSL